MSSRPPTEITNEDIARMWKCTRSRVQQIEKSALAKLRRGLIAATRGDAEFAEWLREHTKHEDEWLEEWAPPKENEE